MPRHCGAVHALCSCSGETKFNYSAYLPDLPGCVSAGETADEVLQPMCEAVGLHLESLREEGKTVPAPTSLMADVKVGFR